MNVEQIKKNGAIMALNNAVSDCLFEVGRVGEGIMHNGRFIKLGDAITRLEVETSKMQELLAELKRLDPKVA